VKPQATLVPIQAAQRDRDHGKARYLEDYAFAGL
jgi:hypothetical protein